MIEIGIWSEEDHTKMTERIREVVVAYKEATSYGDLANGPTSIIYNFH